MNTITENEFFEKFMKISQDLTFSEVRMLYLIITDSSILEMPQEIFAKRIQAHRRTINIGLKKLRKLEYISDAPSPDENEMVRNGFDDAILASEKVTAKKVVINSFNEYYPKNKKDFVVNEDYFHSIIGDIRLPEKYRRNKSFITETIRESYPEIRFYRDLRKSAYNNESHYYITRMVNAEIIKATNDRFYGIKTEPLLRKIYENFYIERDEAFEIIKVEFPKIRLTERRIYLRRSFQGKGSK